MSEIKNFSNQDEIRAWFKHNCYYTPAIIEHKHEWMLRWRDKGSKEIAKGMAKKLEEEGYSVSGIFGSVDNKRNFMGMLIAKCGVTTFVDRIVNICQDDLKLGNTRVTEAKTFYTLVFSKKEVTVEGLNSLIEKLETRFDVISGEQYFPTKSPMGYRVKIKKIDM